MLIRVGFSLSNYYTSGANYYIYVVATEISFKF